MISPRFSPHLTFPSPVGTRESLENGVIILIPADTRYAVSPHRLVLTKSALQRQTAKKMLLTTLTATRHNSLGETGVILRGTGW